MTELINEYFILSERFNPELKISFFLVVFLYIPFLGFFIKKILNKVNFLDKIVFVIFIFNLLNAIFIYNEILEIQYLRHLFSIIFTLFFYIMLIQRKKIIIS